MAAAWAVVLLALAAGAVLISFTSPRGDVARLAVSALLLSAGIATGWVVFRVLSDGADRHLLTSYKPWVMPGESLLIVTVPSHRVRPVVELVRQADRDQPAVFVVRPAYGSSHPRSHPQRRERLALEQLKRYAGELAVTQRVAERFQRALTVQDRVRISDRMIDAIGADLSEAVDREQSVSLAAEWLLDNAYIIQRHIGDVQRNLSSRFANALPVLAGPPYANEPRAFALASEFIAVTDAELYEADIVAFLRAYQETTPLSFSELWAIPLMLRVALIETLSDRARDIDYRQHEHERADLWANRLLTAARRDPDYLLFALAQLAREEPIPSPYVVDRLVSQLQGEALALDPLRTWLESKLHAPLADVIQREQRDYTAHQVTLANAIGSLRQLGNLDWRDVFEQVSVVDEVLRTDPAGVYTTMDFGTRDRYRHAVEEIARGAKALELAVAQTAVAAAGQVATPDRRAHIGYFLIDEGRHELEARTQCHPLLRLRLRRWIRRRSTLVWLGSISTLTVVMLASVLALVAATSAAEERLVSFVAVAVLALFPASEIAIQVVSYVMTRLLPPNVLPKLALDDGIPDEWRTLVVVPNLLLSPDSVQDELEQLEIRYLANQDRNVRFALLTDLPDAPEQEMPNDEVLLAAAVHGVKQLNARYEGTPFSLFFRRRRWSESEQVWMGWERKRGKLEELNRLLVSRTDAVPANTDDQNQTRLQHVGDQTLLEGVRFVITLDVDTQLTRGTARRMIATLAHPLNRPQLAASGYTVGDGYTIIQPRVSTSLPSATATRFSRAFTDPIGTDPYTQAVSDVYQDLTGEGSYHGKGIYDVQMFEQVLSGRFPDAALLSHDLLEGAHVRVGLATDVELFDFFPSTYLAYTARQHRWIRGDWQIADWGMPRVRTAAGGHASNPLSVMNRWKILDNLRRSIVPIVSVGMLIAGWLLLPDAAVIWSGLIGLMLVTPATLQLSSWLATQPVGAIAFWQRWRGWREHGPAWARAMLSAALLPHEAMVALDAIVRVAFRRLISHRLLLEWQTAQETHRSTAARERGLVLRIAAIGVGSLSLLMAIVWLRSEALWPALPFLALWIASPGIVAWLDVPVERQPKRALSADDQLLLRTLARQTWRYFDDFVGPDSHWLPPDNYQDALRIELAQRTSPTNIGLWLLSGLAAVDNGYLTLDGLVTRSSATLETLETLERFEGHLLNWYDTTTLAPLYPRYVSTVDSGNLLTSLWTAAQGYRELLDRPLIGPEALGGIADTLTLLQESLATEPRHGRQSERVDQLTARLAELCTDPPRDPTDISQRLRDAAGTTSQLTVELRQQPLIETGQATPSVRAGQPAQRQAAYWAMQIDGQIRHWIEVVDRYLPWIEHHARRSDEVVQAIHAAAPEWQRQALVEAPSVRALASHNVSPITPPPQQLDETHPIAAVPAGALADTPSPLTHARQHAVALVERVNRLIAQCERLADGMNLRFLYDVDRRLFTIGFNVEARRLDGSYYDMLASEARLASFVSVARDDVPVEHWLALGRTFGVLGRRRVLLSWSGTMFEYLMPLLITRSFANSLLDDACRAAVGAQIDYAARRGVPWGISESAFSAVDTNHIYQYQAFGVPGLGVKRGLEDDVVVAPYASALALAIDPRAAVANLHRLAQSGLRGDYGFYDSIDYTRARQTGGQGGVVAHTYMAHHQGMTLLAIDNALHDNVMQRRFHADRRVRATEPLLFERIPTSPVLIDGSPRDGAVRQLPSDSTAAPPSRTLTPDAPTPRTQLLGHGSYGIMVTSAGGGYSRWRDFDVSRWRADTTTDSWGSYCYIKDVDQGTVWSTAHHPTRRAASRYAVTFTADRAEFERRDVGIGTLTEITVAMEDDVELRRVTLTNYSNRLRHLEVTSFTELALAPHNADLAHPAFSKLFVQTEALPEGRALLARRKPRSQDEQPIWAMHLLAMPISEHDSLDALQYETDRARFVGRGRTAENPLAVEGMLSNTTGAVLDPAFSLRSQLTLEPGQRAQLVFVTGAAETRDGVVSLVEKYRDMHATQRAFELTRFQAQLEPRQLRISNDDIQRFQQLASHMLFPNARLRAAEQRLRQNRLGQSSLWAHGISGDLPILVVTIGARRDLELVREALAAHTYWRLRGYVTDLVLLNEEVGSYAQPLGDELKTLIQWHAQYVPIDQPGGMFLRSVDHIPSDDVTLLLAAARVMLVAARGPLAQQLAATADTQLPPPLAVPRRLEEEVSAPLPFMELPYFNGLGGFTPDGKEYAIYLGPGSHTPAPWVNVFANPQFGAMVSEVGAGFSWHCNSQSNRLLPWSNDPISDPSGDAIYIRDEETGQFWSPTPAPIRELDAYRTRHGQGYTVFEHNSHAIEQELVTFVPMDDLGGATLRIQRLELRNRSARRRRLSVTMYAEWVLGTHRESTQMHVVTNWDSESRALFARNAYHADVGNHIAFASVSPLAASYTADRTEFLGRNGSTDRPAAMLRQSLSGRTGAGLDPCAALQVMVELDPGQDANVIVLVGQAVDAPQARDMLRRFSAADRVDAALATTRVWWDNLLETIQVDTPDVAINFMLNRWLLYQTLSCRVWGRSGFYQSGGAVGFRDQLQDAMALLYAAPERSRQQILTAAARQFVEGDVQHWWHPQSGAGVRTRISDDLLWLPYVTTQYVRVTGDVEILDEIVPFLEGPPLAEHEHERYFMPATSIERESLAEHCQRSIAKGLTRGSHGLPLIGTGDWNDGMNLVGVDGRGESVWLAWFLIDVLKGFADLVERRGQGEAASRYRAEAERLATAVEAEAWDGAWYRRAYFDDGTPLGSKTNDEATIDSLPQSWGVISGAADPKRADLALQAVESSLVREQDGIVLLFTPPFEHTALDPGYIKGYPPGVRENGGQYTHAAIWVALAFARLKHGDRATALLRMLNPIEHTRTPKDVQRYKVEPYVVAADVYALEGHVGQGGWTWYTGSSGWMYRVWIEDVLGFKLSADQLTLDPVLQRDWQRVGIRFRYKRTHYDITIENPDGISSGVLWVELDHQRVTGQSIALHDDGVTHAVTVRLGYTDR